MSTGPPEIPELLIVSVTPQNLERGALWFKENISSIRRALQTHAWWRDNAIVIEQNLILKPGIFSRRLFDLGYERTGSVLGKGLFAVRGGIIEIWPINTEKPYLIEFTGNAVTHIKERPESEEKTKPRTLTSARSIEKLQPGNYVVHVDHGIGIFRGSAPKNQFPISNSQFPKNIEKSITNPQGFFVVEYAPARTGGPPDLLYIATDQTDRLSPYVGFETPAIHRLGGSLWHTTKRKAKEGAERLARELLALYAKRHEVTRASYQGDSHLEGELRHTFPFVETDDQIRAEEEILTDLAGPQPMDRVLCGDVGFGKTEVAIRAALRVISSGKQVAILSPTTVLAAQHEKTLVERFKNIPAEIRMLSRLTAKKDEKKIVGEIRSGKTDLVIGTHRLLSKDIDFKNLGLVIIDEEQRFGVKQKERFKEMRAEVDILSLSATPIPRTLSLALARLRDLSVITTPPPERLPIQTHVLPHSKKLIADALALEFKRGGQAYFLHNRIETIGAVREKLEKIVRRIAPQEAHAIGVIHGRMKENELVRVMDKFRNQDIRVLLATTIIENGLDISSANTLIVDDATRLGLAEAHQLRGRIGRSNTQGFAYFLFKPRHLTEKAAERLDALKEYSELGAGYDIALRDLEIRGAGNILGKEQSGTINKVGLNLYCQMLAEAVEEAKSMALVP